MLLVKDLHIFTGLLTDISASKVASNYLIDAHNIRLTAMDNSTALSITNEKGPKKLTLTGDTLQGTYLGHCVMNEYLVLFTKDKESNNDYIYRIDTNTNISKLLYKGDLKFNLDNPILTISFYENDFILKVYWTDGLNLPRLINVSPHFDGKLNKYHSNYFDFKPTLKLEEKITVEKLLGTDGLFPAGVILYAFTYYNKFMLESNIFYTTPLYCISHYDRGAKPDDIVANSFLITINGVDTNFEFIRVYSILRTSIDATPIVKIVNDYPITSSKIVCLDNGIIGSNIDSYELLYKGGNKIKACTICLKDLTLFLGNISLLFDNIKDIKTKVYNYFNYDNTYNKYKNPTTIEWIREEDKFSYGNFILELKEQKNKVISTGDFYYSTSLHRVKEPHFKSREFYRLGILFLHNSGEWSSPIWVGDYKIMPQVKEDTNLNGIIKVPYIKTTIKDSATNNILETAYNIGFRKIRPLVVLPKEHERTVLFLGIGCPTIFNKSDRSTETLYAQASWFMRPWSAPENTTNKFSMNPTSWASNGGAILYCGKESIYDGTDSGLWSLYHTEYHTVTGEISPFFPATEVQGYYDEDHRFKLDNNFITFHSPDLIHSTYAYNLDMQSISKMNYIGYNLATVTYGDIDVTTSSGTFGDGIGFLKSKIKTEGWASLCSGWFYNDFIVNDEDSNTYNKLEDLIIAVNFPIYLWHRNGSLNNDVNRSGLSALLQTKKISNYRICSTFDFDYKEEDFNTLISIKTDYFNSDDLALLKINNNKYYGNIDTLVVPSTRSPHYFLGYYNCITEKGQLAKLEIRIKADSLDSANVIKNKIKVGDVYYLGEYHITDYNYLKELKDYLYTIKYVSLNITTTQTLGGLKFSLEIHVLPLPGRLPKEYPSTTSQLSIIECIVTDYNNEKLRFDVLKVSDVENNNIGNDTSNIDDTDYKSKIKRCYESLRNVRKITKGKLELESLGIYDLSTTDLLWKIKNEEVGKNISGLTYSKDGVRIKYKSTPHLVIKLLNEDTIYLEHYRGGIPTFEITRDYNENTMFNGYTELALLDNVWIPSGEPVSIIKDKDGKFKDLTIEWTRGDTYFLRYDLLKTYAYTNLDVNLVIDITSFMVESRINLDGRYDRNRGQDSNLNISPLNYNLINNIYSLLDNFFSYKILREDYYDLNNFTNQITWSLLKNSGEYIDTWCNVTLASTHDLDGDKGLITSLNVWNNNIYCFLERGISNILFNSRVLIPTSDNVPIEITNNYKVEGKRYLSDGVGASNREGIKVTPTGIYFLDTITKDLFSISSEGLTNLSLSKNTTTWFNNIDISLWKPSKYTSKLFYDITTSNLYVVTEDDCLVYDNKLLLFTSFMSYENIPLITSIKDKCYCLSNDSKLYSMYEGAYNKFFGSIKPFDLTFISNGLDKNVTYNNKTFTNIELSASMFNLSGEEVAESKEYSRLPFNCIKVWNEYLNTGDKPLVTDRHRQSNTSLRLKFRTWRIDIPRDYKKTRDRILNTWCKIKLTNNGEKNNLCVLHNVNTVFYV